MAAEDVHGLSHEVGNRQVEYAIAINVGNRHRPGLAVLRTRTRHQYRIGDTALECVVALAQGHLHRGCVLGNNHHVLDAVAVQVGRSDRPGAGHRGHRRRRNVGDRTEMYTVLQALGDNVPTRSVLAKATAGPPMRLCVPLGHTDE